MKLNLGDNGFKVLNDKEILQIIDTAMHILEKSGVWVENVSMLDRLAEFGGKADYDKQRIYFEKRLIEQFISKRKKAKWDQRPVSFTAAVEIFQGYFLDPADDSYKQWDQKSFLNYIKVAKGLKNISGIYLLGCPVKEVPLQQQPLYEKLYCWKYGITGGEAIWNTALCPQILELFKVYSDEIGKDIKDVFNGRVYLISPLKFGRVETEQFMYFYEKGLKPRVGYNGALGAAYPATIAGGLALQLAENFFVSIINKTFYNEDEFSIGTSISATDMSTGAFQYGRPEKNISNVAMSQIARFLGVEFSGHCGLSDAKVPGCEAGMQKVSSAIFNAIAGGNGHIAAGLLSSDEVFSPIQMIFDDEITGAFKHVCNGVEVNEETLALESIIEEGPGSNFLATEHTAMNFREALWQPSVWSKSMFGQWDSKGRKNDTDIAKEKYFKLIKNDSLLTSNISEKAESEIMKIISRTKI